MDPGRLHDLLERLAHLLRAEERSRANEHGLQPVQLQALAYLARANRYSDTPAAVTDYLGTTKGTVSQTLKRLQEKGLIEAQPDERDARRVHLRPTASGRDVLRAVLPLPVLARAARRLGAEAEAREDLETGLAGLLASMQREHGSKTFGVCRTCRHFQPAGRGGTCGLTGEALSVPDSRLLCREHGPSDDPGARTAASGELH